jgi:hypothetical protein
MSNSSDDIDAELDAETAEMALKLAEIKALRELHRWLVGEQCAKRFDCIFRLLELRDIEPSFRL